MYGCCISDLSLGKGCYSKRGEGRGEEEGFRYKKPTIAIQAPRRT